LNPQLPLALNIRIPLHRTRRMAFPNSTQLYVLIFTRTARQCLLGLRRSFSWSRKSLFPQNPKVHYLAHKTPPLDFILSQFIPVHTLIPHLSTSIISYNTPQYPSHHFALKHPQSSTFVLQCEKLSFTSI